jgi:predicted Zn-dependent protease
VAEHRHLTGTHVGAVSVRTLRRAVVVDVLREGSPVPVAEADLAWTGDEADLDTLPPAIAWSLERAGRPAAPLPERAHLLFVDGSAGALLHEACGHLLESTAARPSLLAGHLGEEVAGAGLGLTDEPGRGFGAYQRTALAFPAEPRPLLRAGHLAGLLDDGVEGPWRTQRAEVPPRPRMSGLDVMAAADDGALDVALGAVRLPVVRVHRCGPGSLDHRTGAVSLLVKDAVVDGGDRPGRLAPFVVSGEARTLLRGLLAVGSERTVREWSAYCMASSGRLPVGASTPTLLTGPVSIRAWVPPAAACGGAGSGR